jgi:hypothetical protein
METDTRYQQRMGALEEANFIRFSRSQLKRNLRAGNVELADLIEDPPDYIKTMQLLKLILAAPGIGIVRARKILGPNISPQRSVGDLTPRQRSMVVAHIQMIRRGWYT